MFLLYNKVNQLYIYIYPHISSLLHLPPSHPPYPTPLGGHKALSLSPCAMRQLPTSYLFSGGAFHLGVCRHITGGLWVLPKVLKVVISFLDHLDDHPRTKRHFTILRTVCVFIPVLPLGSSWTYIHYQM